MNIPVKNPSLFIGSSREAINYSRAVHGALKRVARVLPWYDGTFQANEYTMESLERRLDQCDFGVFIFSPDDVAIIRGKPVFVTRDNTIFEMGLFWGRLRRKRVFCLIPQEIEHSDGEHIKGEKVDNYRLLSDLSGLTLLTYEYAHDEEYEAAVSEACGYINKAIASEKFYDDPKIKLMRYSSIVKMIWEYNRRIPVTTDKSLEARYHALAEAIRISFLPPPVGNCSVTHVALYAKQSTDGMAYVAGNMDEGQFYSFIPPDPNGHVPVPVVIEVQKTNEWQFTHEQHVEKVSVLCYPLGNDHVVSVYLTGEEVLTPEAQKSVVNFNGELLTTIKHLLGGDSQ